MTLIRGGTIVDGTGKPAFEGDILVEGDSIKEIAPAAVRLPPSPSPSSSPSTSTSTSPSLSPSPSPSTIETIDATGCLVTPGFIDAHTHSDAYLILEPDAPSKITQGITTELNGQCGGSVAPRYGEARLSSDWAALLGERLTWRSLAEYRTVLEAAHPAVNTVQFVGHNTLRSSVVGYAGRATTAAELKRMEYLLAESLDEGGYGFTTGLVYQPGKYSTTAEVVALAKVAAAKGAFYATHMRSESDRILEAIDEVLALVRATGIRAEISHLKTSGRKNWSKIDAVLEKLDAAVAQGELLGSDRYPFCAAGTDLDIVFSDWAGEGGAPYEMQRLEDSALRAKIIAELNASERDWSTVMIGGTWHPDNRRYGGKTVAEILAAEKPGVTVGEFLCELLAKDGCKTGAFFFGMSEENLAKIYSRPWVVPGSDASLRAPWGPLGADHPHPRAYATMPEFYRRVRALGFSREATIARMTSVPARRFELKGRGELVRGAFADLVVWKEDEFKMRSTYTEPHQFTGGVKLVMVNGVVPYRDGRFTGHRAGRLLTR